MLGLKHNRTFLKIRLGVHKPGPGLCEPAMPCREAKAKRTHDRCVSRETVLRARMEEVPRLLGP